MRLMKLASFLVCAMLALCCFVLLRASDEMLIVEQQYDLLELNGRDGVNAKNIKQILYVTPDAVCIDEYGDGGPTPTETYVLDLKDQRIINLDHAAKAILVNETFAERRARILKKKAEVQQDINALEPGKQRKKIEDMYRFMLDDKRQYKTVDDSGKKDVAGVSCKVLKIVDANDPTFVAVEAALHPDIEMPYDNSEVLFLLKIVGEKVSQYLKENKAVFSHVPMELHLTTPDGAKLDTKVLSVKKIKTAEFDAKSRPLGDPFKLPEYKAKPKAGSVAPEKGKAD
ncbi:MAG TPA: hypothetical protein VKX17_25875 [Planctomycetota bacterium]|nr:hypothetical protein [Planctomycetota bacterium]